MNPKNNEIENRLRRAVESETPDVLNQVMAGCVGQDGKVVPLERPAGKRKKWIAAAASAAAVLALVAGGLGTAGLLAASNRPEAVIAFDVNPSIELTINRKERVVKAEARNEEAAAVLEGMDLKGADLKVATNAIVGSLLQHGYLDELANSLLISVEGVGEKGAALQQRLTEEVRTLLAGRGSEPAILSQTVAEDAELRALADEYGLSLGKASLVRRLVRSNPAYTFASLAGLTINELNLLAEKGKTTLENVTAVGTASDKAYIGTDKAKEIALAKAGVAEAEARKLEVELDCEDGRMVYEVEFLAGNVEHECDVDARSGEVVKYKTETEDDDGKDDPAPQPPTVNEREAKRLAFERAGVKEADITGLEIELDRDDGVSKYEIEFKAGGMEYECDVDASTGAILKFKAEEDDAGKKPVSSAPGATLIGDAAAREAAFKRAGVQASAVTGLKLELDEDDGRMLYEIEFKSGGMEYECDVDAYTGEIRKFKAEVDD